MAFVRNDITKIFVPGIGNVPIQVQVEDDQSLALCVPLIVTDEELQASSYALSLLRRYIEQQNIACRAFVRGSTLAGNVHLDTLLLHRGADRVTELLAILEFVVNPEGVTE